MGLFFAYDLVRQSVASLPQVDTNEVGLLILTYTQPEHLEVETKWDSSELKLTHHRHITHSLVRV
ncbi:hypothetical protein D3C85_1745970 [compost metagenome]